MATNLKTFVQRFYETRTAPAVSHVIKTKQPIIWFLAFLIGIAGAYAVLAFRHGIAVLQWLWIGYEAENVAITIAATKPWWQIIAGLTAAGLIVGLLLTYLTPGRRAEGMADVIGARALKGAYMPLKNALASALISTVSLGFGASAGREGPAVHLCASLASLAGRNFNLPFAGRRVLLACGGAAAVSASFNAPIAGVLFAHEVILAHYAFSALTPVIIASVTATVVARNSLGNLPTFAIPAYHINSVWEFPAFLLLGLVCGLVATALQMTIEKADSTSRSVTMPLWLRPVVGALALGILACVIPEIIGVGYEATNLALREKYTLGFLFVLLGAKTLAVAITLASRFGGGIFSPSLYLGAVTGGAFGIIAAGAFPDLASGNGVYALVGMGAVAGAVLGAPMSTVLIVFELTGGYDMTVALLLAVSVASLTNQVIFGQSFFSWQLASRGLFLDRGPHISILQQMKVKQVMTPLEDGDTIGEFSPENRPVLTGNDSFEKAFKLFGQGNYTRLAVLSDPADADTLIGWADYTSLLSAYNAELVAATEEEHR